LPFLWRETNVRHVQDRLQATVICHLHSPLILRLSRLLAGIPEMRFLGHSGKRLSAALREARYWKPFKPHLCPSLAGVELLTDGGYLTMQLDPEASQPPRFTFHPFPR